MVQMIMIELLGFDRLVGAMGITGFLCRLLLHRVEAVLRFPPQDDTGWPTGGLLGSQDARRSRMTRFLTGDCPFAKGSVASGCAI